MIERDPARCLNEELGFPLDRPRRRVVDVLPHQRSILWLHRPRALVMPSHAGRACLGTMKALRGCWTFPGAEPWSPPWAHNDNGQDGSSTCVFCDGACGEGYRDFCERCCSTLQVVEVRAVKA